MHGELHQDGAECAAKRIRFFHTFKCHKSHAGAENSGQRLRLRLYPLERH